MLTASYRRKENGVTVELYGKTSDNESIVVLCPDFDPYFYVVAPVEAVKPILRGDDEIKNLEEVSLLHRGEDTACTKVTMTRPWLVPEYRKRVDRFETLASDIPFGQRFIYDNDLGACFSVKGEEIQSQNYTADLVVRASEFGEVEAFLPDLKILSFDIENSIKTKQIYTICCAVRENGGLKHESFAGDEKELILDFVKYVQEEDPDIITGYNIDGYDLPMVLERAKFRGVDRELKIGRDFSLPNRISNRFWRLHGRIIADAWWNVKRELKPKKETLNNVSKILLGEEKEDVDPRQIDEEWTNNKEKVISYCKKDAELALRVLEKINVLQKNMDLATVSKLPLDNIINGTTSVMIDSILIREADRRCIAVPMTRHVYEKNKIEGGYVHKIVPGVYHWVCVLDFKSMYPSIVISKNICITTLSKRGTIESPEGVRFLTKEERKGIFPIALERLMKDRDDAKKKMREAASDEEREYYDRLQNAIKILMNAFYGVLASSFYRFTHPRIGASITAFARESIKSIIKHLEDEDLKVVYSDTDSVFFQSPYENLDETVKFGKKISERFSEGGVILEFEKVMEPLFSHGKKKRYVGKVIWPVEDTIVRGYEVRRTDSFDLQSETLSMVLDNILNDNINDAISKSRDVIDKILKGDVSKEKLVISRSVKPYKFYKDADSQTNVQAAKKLEKLGYEFVPGMKVSWIVINGKNTPQVVEPYIDGKEFQDEPDWKYYARRVAMTVARVTEVFDWDAEALLTGTQQQTLFGKFGTKKKETAKPIITKEQRNLQDYF